MVTVKSFAIEFNRMAMALGKTIHEAIKPKRSGRVVWVTDDEPCYI